jgi:hypothetical protein
VIARHPSPRHVLAAGLAVVTLLGACGDGDDTVAATTTTAAPTTTTTEAEATTTSGSEATTTTTEPPAEPVAVDPEWRAYDERWLVTGVDADDTLNVRRAPGVAHPVVAELAPDADDVEVFDAVEWVEGARWGAVAVDGGAGWVNLVHLRPPGTDPPEVVGTEDPRAAAAAEEVRTALVDADHEALAGFVDERGLTVSAYAFVDDDAPVLAAGDITGAPEDDTIVVWGVTDGEGAPIELTIERRLRQLGTDYALTSTDAVGFDTRVGTGNTIDNLAERFPGASVVEYHFAGTSLYEDFDWSSLRFVFDTAGEGAPVLLAIVEDGWTI